MSRIDRSKIKVTAKGFKFDPFRPQAKHQYSLADVQLKEDVELLAFERDGQRRAVLISEVMYHHIVQGELAGEPYLVTY